MDGISCDRCGEGLLLREDVRYVMRLEIQAAYDPLELTARDLERDLEGEFRKTIESLENADGETLARQVHYEARFDLCGACQQALLADPLGGKPGGES